jgi:peptidoglycan/LPS O-acetylase OafA/YrhL
MVYGHGACLQCRHATQGSGDQMKYIEQLTWLRGIAAFLVVLTHTLRATEVRYSPHDVPSYFLPMNLMDLGSYGVTLFFALSGCTLFISHAEKMDFKNMWSFYVKRFFRVWPAFIVSLFIYACFVPVFKNLYPDPHGFWIENQFYVNYGVHDVINYALLIFNITGPSNLFNGAYWSLPVEFQYYLLFPVLVGSLRLVGVLGPVVIGFLLYWAPHLGGINVDRTEVFTLAFSFCGGILAAYLFTHTKRRLSMPVGLVLLFSCLMLAAMAEPLYSRIPRLAEFSNQWNWYAFASILTVLVALMSTFQLPSLLEAFLKKYGTISYSVYLYHNLFVGLAVLMIVNFGIVGSHQKLWFTFFLALVPSYFVANWSYLHVEKRFIDIGRKILSTRKSGALSGRA